MLASGTTVTVSRSPTVRAGCWRSPRLACSTTRRSGSNLCWRPSASTALPASSNFPLERIRMTIETEFDSNYRKVLVAARRARQMQKRLGTRWFQPVQQGLPHCAGRNRSRQDRCTSRTSRRSRSRWSRGRAIPIAQQFAARFLGSRDPVVHSGSGVHASCVSRRFADEVRNSEITSPRSRDSLEFYNQAMRVTVGVSGGIAAYKAAELVRALQRQALKSMW